MIDALPPQTALGGVWEPDGDRLAVLLGGRAVVSDHVLFEVAASLAGGGCLAYPPKPSAYEECVGLESAASAREHDPVAHRSPPSSELVTRLCDIRFR